MEDLTVSSLWLSSDKITKDEMAELYTVLHTSVNNDEYTAVVIDYTDGTGLDLFNEADLVFSGIDFLNNIIDPSVPFWKKPWSRTVWVVRCTGWTAKAGPPSAKPKQTEATRR